MRYPNYRLHPKEYMFLNHPIHNSVRIFTVVCDGINSVNVKGGRRKKSASISRTVAMEIWQRLCTAL